MTDPLATAVIDAARAYRDAFNDTNNLWEKVAFARTRLFATATAFDAAHPTTRHTLPGGETLVVEGDGVTVR